MTDSTQYAPDTDLTALPADEARALIRSIHAEVWREKTEPGVSQAGPPAGNTETAQTPEEERKQAALAAVERRKEDAKLATAARVLLEEEGQATAEDLAGIPDRDVIELAGFVKSEAALREEEALRRQNDPAEIQKREIADLRNKWWSLAPDERAETCATLGLDLATETEKRRQEMIDRGNQSPW